MKAVYAWAGAVLGVLACASLVRADPYAYCPRYAPDACGPGYYMTNPCGATYGPCYNLRPPFPPVGGLPPVVQQGSAGGGGGGAAAMGPQGPSGIAAFPSHPFARGPRDYFMED